MSIDFVLRKKEKYYLRTFLKECKYIENEKKMTVYFTDD